MNIKKTGHCITAIVYLSIFFLMGCSKDDVKPGTGRILLPRVHDGGGYRTDPFEQWIEIRRVFPSDEAAAVVICCKGTVGVVGNWKTHTVCWADISTVEVGYESVKIETHSYYGADSGPSTTERGYWPVDFDGDGLDDLMVVEWEFGEQGEHVENKHGERVYVRIPYDNPVSLRLICRESIKGCPYGIRSDSIVKWSEVVKGAKPYKTYVENALRQCKCDKWKGRLIKMRYLLNQRKGQPVDAPAEMGLNRKP